MSECGCKDTRSPGAPEPGPVTCDNFSVLAGYGLLRGGVQRRVTMLRQPVPGTVFHLMPHPLFQVCEVGSVRRYRHVEICGSVRGGLDENNQPFFETFAPIITKE